MRRILLLVLLALVIMPVGALAQTVAQLSGNVMDESGGALPGVEVTVTQTATGMTRFVITETNGSYVFTTLPVGPYKLTAKLDRLQDLRADRHRPRRRRHAVGQRHDEGRRHRRDGAGAGRRDPGRDPQREPGRARPAGADRQPAAQRPQRAPAHPAVRLGGRGPRVDGQPAVSELGRDLGRGRHRATARCIWWTAATTTTRRTTPATRCRSPTRCRSSRRKAACATPGTACPPARRSTRSPSPARTTSTAAHSSSCATTASTRSGTSSARRTAASGRTTACSGTSSAAPSAGPSSRTSSSSSAGPRSPRPSIAPTSSDQFVPTVEVRNGDFRRIMSAACRGGTARTLGAPFVNNQIDPALYNPIALKMMSMLPLPDPALDPDGCGRYVLQIPNDSDEQQYIGRADYQATSNKRVFGRVVLHELRPRAEFRQGRPNLLHLSGNGLGIARQHEHHRERPRLGRRSRPCSRRRASRFSTPPRERIQGDGAPTWTTLGVKTFQYTTGNGQDFLAGGTAGWSASGFTGAFYVLHAVDRAGLRLDQGIAQRLVRRRSGRARTPTATGRSSPTATWASAGSSPAATTNTNGGLNMADFVLGLPATFNQAGSQINNQSINAFGLYAGDVWRAEPQHYPELRDPVGAVPRGEGRSTGSSTAFSRENFDKGIRSVVYPNAPVGLVFTGDPGFPDNGSNNTNQPRAVRAARRPRVGSEGRQRADDSRGHRALLRFAETLGLRATTC